MTDFRKIMEGFVQAQIKGGALAGLDFLNGVNIVLETQLEMHENTDKLEIYKGKYEKIGAYWKLFVNEIELAK